jgi:hypothetical protein
MVHPRRLARCFRLEAQSGYQKSLFVNRSSKIRRAASGDPAISFRRLLRTRPSRVPLFVAGRAALRFSAFRCNPEHGRQLGIDLFSLCDEFFHPRDLIVDVHCNRLLLAVALMLTVDSCRRRRSTAFSQSVALRSPSP